MFGNKKNINILVALLIKHGVKRAVVCPGSRNAPIVHTLNECEDIACYPVTDERSADFMLWECRLPIMPRLLYA